MSDVEVVVLQNGPYKISGTIEVVDHEGRTVELAGTNVFLCRCGHSANKPFCDGSHARTGFDGALAWPDAS